MPEVFILHWLLPPGGAYVWTIPCCTNVSNAFATPSPCFLFMRLHNGGRATASDRVAVCRRSCVPNQWACAPHGRCEPWRWHPCCSRVWLRRTLRLRTGFVRSVADRMNCPDATVPFLRFVEAPTMSADDVVKTMRHLVQERCADVKLLAALSKRFHSYAEEFFPPQIEELVGHFATLGYTDAHLRHGTLGRLQDVTSDASPRRVLRLMRAMTTLRWPAKEWFPDAVRPALRRHLPNFHEGIPSALIFLQDMRWKDAELEELLLTQGFIVAEELGDVYLARVLEAWSRMGSTDPEAVDRSKQMVHNICGPGAQKHRELGHDLRDALNVLATLTRMCPKSQERSTLEAHLASQLSAVNSTEAMLALQWLQRLALDSAPIWKACAEVTELALEEKNFVRDHFAHAVHCLASVAGEQTQAALISQLISSPEVKHGAPRLSAEKTLQVLHAASMMDLKDSVVADWESQAARLARQMSLPDRRTLRIISDARPTASKLKTAMAQLPIAHLPPLRVSPESDELEAVQIGGDVLLQPKGGGKEGIKYMGHWDSLVGRGKPKGQSSPSCQLSIRVRFSDLKLVPSSSKARSP
ncbi:unnamed protein product [Durusdinium trenchii]|uniref:Uncharacterized protein n=1 Tax=Durusdinium trenchii TaxID=1381693 RepID=A0ABP0K4U2_9DINO